MSEFAPEQADEQVELALPALDYGPIRSPIGEIRCALRPAISVIATLSGEVNVSPRVKEPILALPSGETVILTSRRNVPRPTSMDDRADRDR